MAVDVVANQVDVDQALTTRHDSGIAKVLWITQSFVDGLPFIVCTSPLAARCGIDICPTVRPTIAAHPGL